MLIIKPNKVRKSLSSIIEYFLVVQGRLLLVTYDEELDKVVNMLATTGMCFRTPIGTSHSFHAIDESTCISLLTKPWDDCKQYIVNSKVY